MKLNINHKGNIVGSMNKITYQLDYKQRIWLRECLHGDDMEIKDWYLTLPLSVDNTNMLNDILTDGSYDDRGKSLLNWLREEYISTFGIGSTLSVIDSNDTI